MTKKKVSKNDYSFLKAIKNTAIRLVVLDERENLLQRVKELTHGINYGCKFVDGKCQKYSNVTSDGKFQVPKGSVLSCGCCCGSCVNTFGYLKSVCINNIKEYSDAWNDETGFFEKDKGCRLPRRLRPGICISYRCTLLKDIDNVHAGLLTLLQGY